MNYTFCIVQPGSISNKQSLPISVFPGVKSLSFPHLSDVPLACGMLPYS